MHVTLTTDGTQQEKHLIEIANGNVNSCDQNLLDDRVNLKDFLDEQLQKCLEDVKDREENEESFYVADMGEVQRQFSRWQSALGRVQPYYAIKCNPDKEVIRLLAALGAGFDCSSRWEIETVLNMGIHPSRVIYANTCKPRSHLRYAQSMGVRKMTFDSADELYKIKAGFPEAKLILRIAADDSSSLNQLNLKFGAPLNTTRQLLQIASDLNLHIVGISFHVGSGAVDPQLFFRAIQDSRIVFDQAKEYGFSPNILDIGGGFSMDTFQDMYPAVNMALDEFFPEGGVDFIAEPGRYFVESAFTLACNIIARRDTDNENDSSSKPQHMLYLMDGIYGNFMDNFLSQWRRPPCILRSANEQVTSAPVDYSIWGPTCDGLDLILEKASFQRHLNVGDWLSFDAMGAYTSCFATSFNGFPNKTTVHYVSSELSTKKLLQY